MVTTIYSYLDGATNQLTRDSWDVCDWGIHGGAMKMVRTPEKNVGTTMRH